MGVDFVCIFCLVVGGGYNNGNQMLDFIQYHYNKQITQRAGPCGLDSGCRMHKVLVNPTLEELLRHIQ